MASTLGRDNPFRYRGYYYDTETGFYYLNARYYNPEWGRFISADSVLDAERAIGCNLFAYCFNDPVNYTDHNGNWPSLSSFFFAVVVVAVSVAAVALTCGAAAPVLAAAGGVATAGTATAAAIAATSTTVAVKSIAIAAGALITSAACAGAEQMQEQMTEKSHYVYTLVDSDNEVQYVGRTTDVSRRAQAHRQDPNRKDLQMIVISEPLTYFEARGLEQIAMMHYHTLNTANRMNNQINGISPHNKRLLIYMEAGRGVAKYIENQVSNIILNWTGK